MLERIRKQGHTIRLYVRYVDDIFTIAHSEKGKEGNSGTKRSSACVAPVRSLVSRAGCARSPTTKREGKDEEAHP